jgi:hypothetical protein
MRVGRRMRALFAFVPLAVIVGCMAQDAPVPAQEDGAGAATARSADQSGFTIIKLDPALDAIVSADATLETVGDRFGLTEGPLWVQEATGGYLLVSDLIANVIYKWTPDGRLSAFLETFTTARTC